MDRLRLSEFTRWIGEERETFRSILNRGEAPILPKREGETQRTYDGADLLAWCLFAQLRQHGIATARAGDAVLASDAVAQFHAGLAQGENVSDFNLIMWTDRRDRGDRGRVEVPNQMIGTSADAAAILANEAEEYGRETLSGHVRQGISALTVVPVMPCYQRCKTTAKAHGFELHGADLIEAE